MSTCNSLNTNGFSLLGNITWLFSTLFLWSILSLLSSRLRSSRQSLLNLNDSFATSAAVIFFWNSFTSLIFLIKCSWSWAFLMLSQVNKHTAASRPLYNISTWISLPLVLNTLTVGIRDSLLFCWLTVASKINLISQASQNSLYSLM